MHVFRLKFSRRSTIVIASLATIGIGVALWETLAEPRLVARNFGVVEAGSIYRSGQLSQYVVDDVLAEHRIGTIVFLSGDRAGHADVAAEAEAAKRLEIERYNFPLRGDGTGDIRQYARALQTIVQSQREFKPVLIHCSAGAQRTGAAVAFYRLLIQQRPPAEVYAELKAWEHDPSDNPRLVPYVNANIEELARQLVARRVIDRMPATMPKLGHR